MPLTSEQRNAIAESRAHLKFLSLAPTTTAESVDQRARRPDPAHVPTDVSVHVEIAPPSPHPHPLLEGTGALKAPERVPIYFYTLHSDQAKSDLTDAHVIFFIHGGGNVTGHPTHPPFIDLYTRLLRAVASHSGDTSKCVLVAPSYRLATVPENTFPAALQDIVAAYEYVLAKGYKASNIFIAGDSAGGSHAVVSTYLILQSGKPAPRGLIPIAPTLIHEYDLLSEYARAQDSTDLLSIAAHEQCSSTYAGDSGVALTDPLISGVFIPFTASWPKTLILIGSGDVLIDSSRELKKRLSVLNIPVELVEYDERPHGWWVMPQDFPEDVQDAVQRISRFVLEST